VANLTTALRLVCHAAETAQQKQRWAQERRAAKAALGGGRSRGWWARQGQEAQERRCTGCRARREGMGRPGKLCTARGSHKGTGGAGAGGPEEEEEG